MIHQKHIPSRREILGGLAALGAAPLLPARALAQAPAKPFRIDMHHHFLPQAYMREEAERISLGRGTPSSIDLSA